MYSLDPRVFIQVHTQSLCIGAETCTKWALQVLNISKFLEGRFRLGVILHVCYEFQCLTIDSQINKIQCPWLKHKSLLSKNRAMSVVF